jgi:hypothetical protein
VVARFIKLELPRFRSLRCFCEQRGNLRRIQSSVASEWAPRENEPDPRYAKMTFGAATSRLPIAVETQVRIFFHLQDHR